MLLVFGMFRADQMLFHQNLPFQLVNFRQFIKPETGKLVQAFSELLGSMHHLSGLITVGGGRKGGFLQIARQPDPCPKADIPLRPIFFGP